MNRNTLFFLVHTVVIILSVSIPAAMPASSTTSGALFFEYYDSEDSDRDIRVGNLGTDSSREWLGILNLIGAIHLMGARGSRTIETEEGIENQNANVLGLGFYTVLRLGPRLGPIVPFVEAGPGMLFTTGEFPPGGTHWNFNQRYGYGASVKVKRDLYLGVSLRHLHISNGKGIGHPRNPSYDGNGFVIELRH